MLKGINRALAIVFLAALLGGSPAPASANDEQRESVLVSGTGTVSGTPDTLEAAFGVETSATTVDAAMKQATAAATRMRDTLVKGGVTRADLQTSNVNVTSMRKDDGPITGYTVSQGLTAKIRKLAKAGALMSAAVAAGGDAARLSGVSFSIDDDAALLAQARKKAFADARGKAELYAREAGRPLGRVVRVNEGGQVSWPQGGQDRFAAADASIPIEPGRQQLSVTVTVEWALDPPATPKG
ncbi:SIMPL domain-containing protein [Paractinoplanes lichenicola]|uniref:SIMPL domain-containing protein n=1 Tax=Paractinoplanes lichenicola TaxID=2802976 RepID=A0ABS1VMJ0_9ACTN|nr:SIMPL domain-containing protein [Actinoplanes lichenicola]MBL7255873.1 SIMPL domain-containing protein [Actinoplanes lichenicola]